MNGTDQAAHASGGHPPKLLDQVAAKMRLSHYSKRTARAYVDWIKRYSVGQVCPAQEVFVELDNDLLGVCRHPHCTASPNQGRAPIVSPDKQSSFRID